MSESIVAKPWEDPDEESGSSNQSAGKSSAEEPTTNNPPVTPFSMPPPGFDEFDPANLRLDQSYLQQPAATKALTEVPVLKPNNIDFIRVHPSPDYQLQLGLIALGKRNEDVYAILPFMIPYFNEGEYSVCKLFLYTNRAGDLFFWPIKLPREDGTWNTWPESAMACANQAMIKWVRVAANRKVSAYEQHAAQGRIPDPEWPKYSLRELLQIAFKNGRIVNNPNHEILLKLKGLI